MIGAFACTATAAKEGIGPLIGPSAKVAAGAPGEVVNVFAGEDFII